MRERQLLEEEIKLLFVLLDAADTAGSIADRHRQRWDEARKLFTLPSPPPLGTTLYGLIEELSASGALKEIWIQERWLAMRTRIEIRTAPKPRR